MIKKIYKGEHSKYEFIVDSLSKMLLPSFENKEENEFYSLIGAFLDLIDLTIQIEKLSEAGDWKRRSRITLSYLWTENLIYKGSEANKL